MDSRPYRTRGLNIGSEEQQNDIISGVKRSATDINVNETTTTFEVGGPSSKKCKRTRRKKRGGKLLIGHLISSL